MTKILVIEDDSIIREEILEWLGFEDFEAHGAKNGREGVAKALDVLPDLIISDISMPEMNGYEVLDSLRQHDHMQKIPFIFLTAHADKSSMRQGMQMGADDYLTKPFTIDELIGAIHSRISRQHAIAKSMEKDVEDLKLRLMTLVNQELKMPVSSLNFVQQVIEQQIHQLEKDEIADLMQTLRVGTDRLQHLVQHTVYFTQIETGVITKQSIKQEGKIIALWQIIPSAVDQARHYAMQNANAIIHIDQRDSTLDVFGDPQLFKHALSEFLCNMLNRSGHTQEIKLTTWQEDSTVWIILVNEGRKVAPDASPQLAELGLDVAQRIVELHDGTWRIETLNPNSTQITLSFPLV